MAEQILNTGSSVVDYLKSTGKDSSFSSRKSLYETSGLKERLGDYTGSTNQNLAFLKQLQSSTGPALPTPITGETTTPSGAVVNTETEALVSGPQQETPVTEKPSM